MVPALGLEGVSRSVGAEEKQSLGTLNHSNAVKAHATVLSRNLAGFARWDGKEQLVVFAAVQGEVPSIVRRDGAAAADRTRDLFLSEERPDAARGAEVCKIGGKAVAHVDQRGGQPASSEKSPQGTTRLRIEMS